MLLQTKSFTILDDEIYYKNSKNGVILISNFILRINAENEIQESTPDTQNSWVFEVKKGEKKFTFSLPVNGKLEKALVQSCRALGTEFVVNDTGKRLLLAAQEISQPEFHILDDETHDLKMQSSPPERIKTFPHFGFIEDGDKFIANGILIDRSGIIENPSGYKYSPTLDQAKKLRLTVGPPDQLKVMGRHLVEDFLELKSHDVTLPLLGHIALAPFSSIITSVASKNHYVLHLQGPSGSRKSFISRLAMNFFGDFQDYTVSWTSTGNFIEVLGFYFKDSIFLVDDLKPGISNYKEAQRIIQSYADNYGRGRLKPNSKPQLTYFIKGALLTSGEDFFPDSPKESVLARAIIIDVEAGKNERAGQKCLAMRKFYPILIPQLLQRVLSNPNWKDHFINHINEFTASVDHNLALSNGLRIASNWALNSFGINLLLAFLLDLNVLSHGHYQELQHEYVEIADSYLVRQTQSFQEERPVSALFRSFMALISQNKIHIQGVRGTQGEPVGELRKLDTGSYVILYPEQTTRACREYYSKFLDRSLSFTPRMLRDDLKAEGLIEKENGRYTHQIRQGTTRINTWAIPESEFKLRLQNEAEGIY